MPGLTAPTCPASRTPARTGVVAAVVVSHHSTPEAARCVRALWRDDPDLAVVVVENSGDPAEAAALAAELPRATVLATDNRGFGAGCNTGIDHALAHVAQLDAVLLINPDAEPEPGALAHLRATLARHPDAGAVGARLLARDGRRVLFEHGRVRRWTLARSHARWPRTAPGSECPTEFLTGACLLVAADLLRAGLRFDEGYFLYVEDLDLSCAIAARGRTLWVNRDAVVRHDEGGTQREVPLPGGMRARQLYWLTKGKVRFARKWLSPLQRACFLAVACVLKPIAGVVAWRSARFLGPYFAGLRDGLRDSARKPA